MKEKETYKLIDYTDFSYLEFTEEAEGRKIKDFSLCEINQNKDKNSISNKCYKENKKYFFNNKKEDIVKKMKYIDENLKNYLDYEILEVERDDTTGFYAMALKNEDDIIISYKGSDFNNKLNDWIHNIFKLPQDYLTDQGQQASNFFRKVADNNPNSKIIISGHSLGGFLSLETAVTNIGYIDRIKMVYSFDAPGFTEEFVKGNESIIEIFLQENKIFETEMTFIRRLMYRLQDKNLNYVVRTDEHKNMLEALYVHPIEKFRLIYPYEEKNEDIRKFFHKFYIFKEKETFAAGKIQEEFSNKMGDNLTTLAEAMQIKPNNYKDIETGLTMQVTLNRETLSIDEFLNKVNKNLFWDEEENFIKKIKEIKELDRNPKYLVRGAILKCDKGSHMRRVDLRLCHGVYFKGGPALHIEDCEVGEGKNIKSFGMCSQKKKKK